MTELSELWYPQVDLRMEKVTATSADNPAFGFHKAIWAV